MRRPYSEIVGLCWLAFWVYWSLRSLRTRRPLTHASWPFTIADTVILYIGFVLIFLGRAATSRFSPRFTSDAAWIGVLGTALVIAGIAFAIWSRAALGANWSSRVGMAAGQCLVTDGPYAVVRNPMYSGMSLAALGTSLVVGSLASLLGFVLVFGSLWWKGRVEERFLAEAFGEEYARYRRRVKSMVPFIL